jgi:hypothetical protein
MPPQKEAKLLQPTKLSKRRLVTFSSPTEASVALAMNCTLLHYAYRGLPPNILRARIYDDEIGYVCEAKPLPQD